MAASLPQQTTPVLQRSSGFVTVTDPYHPLHGQWVEIIRLRRGVDPDIVIRLADGTHMAIAMSRTDYAGLPAPDDLRLPPPLLDLHGLQQMADVVAFLRETQHSQRSDR